MFSLAICFLTFFGCSSGEKPDVTLIQAHEMHLEAVAKHEAVKHALDSLRNQPGPNPRLDSLAAALAEWEERLVEVPGFEDHADHEGHEHHHHATAPDLSPAQMLDVQREFLREISELADLIARK